MWAPGCARSDSRRPCRTPGPSVRHHVWWCEDHSRLAHERWRKPALNSLPSRTHLRKRRPFLRENMRGKLNSRVTFMPMCKCFKDHGKRECVLNVSLAFVQLMLSHWGWIIYSQCLWISLNGNVQNHIAKSNTKHSLNILITFLYGMMLKPYKHLALEHIQQYRHQFYTIYWVTLHWIKMTACYY